MTTLLPLSLDIEQFIEDIHDRPAIWNRSYSCSKTFMESTWSALAEKHQLSPNVLKAKWKGLRDNFRVEFKRIPRDEHGNLLIDLEQYKSKWIHYNALLFLADHMRSRQPKYEPVDAYFFGENRPNFDYEESSRFSDGLIQIPDDEPLSTNFDRVKINMATLQVPCGAAAILAQPILNDDQIPIPPKKLRKEELQNSGDEPDQSSNSFQYQNMSPFDQGLDKIMDDDHHFLLSLHPYMAELKHSQKLRIRMKIQKLIFKELYKDEENEE